MSLRAWANRRTDALVESVVSVGRELTGPLTLVRGASPAVETDAPVAETPRQLAVMPTGAGPGRVTAVRGIGAISRVGSNGASLGECDAGVYVRWAGHPAWAEHLRRHLPALLREQGAVAAAVRLRGEGLLFLSGRFPVDFHREVTTLPFTDALLAAELPRRAYRVSEVCLRGRPLVDPASVPEPTGRADMAPPLLSVDGPDAPPLQRREAEATVRHYP